MLNDNLVECNSMDASGCNQLIWRELRRVKWGEEKRFNIINV